VPAAKPVRNSLAGGFANITHFVTVVKREFLFF